jgi:isopentenyl-diphosphate Delta-isomerase
MANLDELVDIVDADNMVLSQITKKEAHEKGLLHRTTISQIKNSQGQWLLVQQSSDRQDAGQYVSPVGGHVQAGETEDEALKREAQEECGFVDFDYKSIGKKIFNRNVLNRQENHYFIVYEIYSDKPLVLNEESVSHRAFTEQELKDALKQTPKMFGDAFHFVMNNFYPELLL